MVSRDCYVALPHGSIGFSAICDCTGYIVFLFCYKYMQTQNAKTKYVVLLILAFYDFPTYENNSLI